MKAQDSTQPPLSVLLVEPDDGLTAIGLALAEQQVSVELLTEPTDRSAPPVADVLLVAGRAVPSDDLESLKSRLAASHLPVVLVLEAESLSTTAAGVAWLTWPASGEALVAACRGLVHSDDRMPTLQARSPGEAAISVLYGEIVGAAAQALEAAAAGRAPDLKAIRLLAERVHSRLLRDNGLVNQSLEPHGESDLASHSANVAIISGKIGMGLAFGVEDIVRLVMSGIVHDVGMAQLPKDLLQKPGILEAEELALLRTHPVLGAELLADVDSRYSWLVPVILQEHERRQGQGYPAGLLSSAIDPLAQVVGLADVFEALSHPRTYRSPYTALEALEQVSEMKGEYFDHGMVAALINEISAFPLDSYVQLSTGEIGQVVGTNPENILRPEILVRWDAGWNLIADPYHVDLATMPDVTVARALMEAELPIT
jgi:response regulator RpfG family c-di-GMP phosphodiesterase